MHEEKIIVWKLSCILIIRYSETIYNMGLKWIKKFHTTLTTRSLSHTFYYVCIVSYILWHHSTFCRFVVVQERMIEWNQNKMRDKKYNNVEWWKQTNVHSQLVWEHCVNTHEMGEQASWELCNVRWNYSIKLMDSIVFFIQFSLLLFFYFSSNIVVSPTMH